MEGDGWARGSDGIWAKGGQRASAAFKTTAGNKRRELTQQIVQEQARAAGFEITIDNQAASDLFGSQLPEGDFQLALYAQVMTSLDPSNCSLFCSVNIPTDANGFSGQNWTRTNIPGVDPLLATVDTNLDDDERAAAQKEADGLLAEDATSIPLDPLPNILLWSDKIVGAVGDNPILGPFHNMNVWGLAR
jgi:peptide/nickel transport system substrate-binding protein